MFSHVDVSLSKISKKITPPPPKVNRCLQQHRAGGREDDLAF